MKIAIEALGIHYFGGGRSATLNLLEALFALDQSNEYLVFLSQPEPTLQTPAGNVHQWVAPVKNRFALRLWAQTTLPFMTWDCDVVHFVKNLGVFGVRPPTVVTLYDMTTLIYPALSPKFDVWYWKHLQPQTLARARRIIAISHNTARDAQRLYGLPPANFEVIYPSYAPRFKPATAQEVARVRDRYQLPDDYVLHLGRIDGVKNLDALLHAFAAIKSQNLYCGKLVLTGEEYAKTSDQSIYTLAEELGLKHDLIFTGPVPDEDAPAIFSGAQVAVMASVYEGFGIVALEAMASGAPLIVTDAGALGETVGDAAIVLQQGDPLSLADALLLMLTQPKLRMTMRERGFARIKSFNWHDSARQTLRVYTEVAQQAQS